MPIKQNYDAEFKMELVLEVLKGRKSSEVAEENGVSRNSIYAWKREFLNGLTNDNKAKSKKDMELRKKDEQIEEMKKIIGDQKLQMEILKKKPWLD